MYYHNQLASPGTGGGFFPINVIYFQKNYIYDSILEVLPTTGGLTYIYDKGYYFQDECHYFILVLSFSVNFNKGI